MLVPVRHGVFNPGREDDIVDHPDAGEDEDDNEENLEVRHADVDVLVSASAHQRDTQHQDVDEDDPGQNPSPVSVPFLTRRTCFFNRVVRLVRVLRRGAVRGGVTSPTFNVFVHPAGFARAPVGQTVARGARVQTHGCFLRHRSAFELPAESVTGIET